MKKSVVILIAIIYVGSIFIINLFGLKMSIYNERFPVERIECINKEETGVKISSTLFPVNGAHTPVSEWEKIPTIKIKFEGAGYVDENGIPQGTSFYLQIRVYPNNATEKTLDYKNYSNSTTASIYQNSGLILFSEKSSIIVKITPTEKNNPTFLYVMVIAS